MRLRAAVGVAAAALLVLGAVLALTVNPAFAELALTMAIVLVGVLFEARRYQARTRPGGSWQETGERFIDPSTGHLMEVRFNPQTGEREYVDRGPQPS